MMSETAAVRRKIAELPQSSVIVPAKSGGAPLQPLPPNNEDTLEIREKTTSSGGIFSFLCSIFRCLWNCFIGRWLSPKKGEEPMKVNQKEDEETVLGDEFTIVGR